MYVQQGKPGKFSGGGGMGGAGGCCAVLTACLAGVAGCLCR